MNGTSFIYTARKIPQPYIFVPVKYFVDSDVKQANISRWKTNFLPHWCSFLQQLWLRHAIHHAKAAVLLIPSQVTDLKD